MASIDRERKRDNPAPDKPQGDPAHIRSPRRPRKPRASMAHLPDRRKDGDYVIIYVTRFRHAKSGRVITAAPGKVFRLKIRKDRVKKD